MANVEPVVFHLNLVIEGTHAGVLLQDGREVNRHLLLRGAITVGACACGDGCLCACGELGHLGRLGTILKGKWLSNRDGPGKIPSLADGFVVDKLALLERDSRIIDAHHHSLTSVLRVHLRHLRRRLGRPVVLIGIFASRHWVEILERGGSNASETALPKVSVVVERRVRVAGERDGIGIIAEQLCHRSVVSAPSPRAVAGVFGVWMLDVEEGFPVGSQLRVVLFEEVGES